MLGQSVNWGERGHYSSNDQHATLAFTESSADKEEEEDYDRQHLAIRDVRN